MSWMQGLATTGPLILLALLAGCGPQGVTIHPQERIPDDLEAWGIVELDGDRLVWSDQVQVYDLNTPLFTDYAHKLRTAYVPEGKQAQLADNGDLTWPVGTVFSKTFYYPRGQTTGRIAKTEFDPSEIENGLSLNDHRLIETRLLVHYDTGWKAIGYVWDQDQARARREVTGALVPLTLETARGQQDFTYVVPDANQCIGCHATAFNTKQALPIGPGQARFINRNVPGQARNQLAVWQERGWLSGTYDRPVSAPDWRDDTVSVEARARAYLDINCGHCHSPEGAGDTSGLWLRQDVTTPGRLGVCKPPIAAGQGTGGNRWGITPGKPDESILHYRMASLDPGAMMPELGRSLVHEEGVELIAEWIAGMEGKCNEPEAGYSLDRTAQ